VVVSAVTSQQHEQGLKFYSLQIGCVFTFFTLVLQVSHTSKSALLIDDTNSAVCLFVFAQ